MAYSIASDSLTLDYDVECMTKNSIASDSLGLDPGKPVPEMFCESCKQDQKHSAATGFCVDCVEYYCDVCFRLHGRFAPTHVLENAQSMPRDFCLEICRTHVSEIIKFICLDCKQVACYLCKQKSHNKCNSVKHIPTYVKTEKFNYELHDFMHSLKEVDDRLKLAAKTAHSNSTQIESYCYIAKMRVRSHRHEINMKLDELEGEIEGIIESTRKTDQSAMTSLKAKYEALVAILNPIHSSVEMLTQKGQLSTALVTIQRSKSEIDTIQNEMVGLREDSNGIFKATGVYEFVPETSILQLESIGKLRDVMSYNTDNTDNTFGYAKGDPIKKFCSIGMEYSNDDVDIQVLPSLKLSVAVFGESGSGKSVFINNLLGLDDDHAYDNSVYKATIKERSFCSTTYPHVVAHEFPGIDATEETISELDKLKNCIICILISSGCVMDSHIRLAEKINNLFSKSKAATKRKGHKLYFVRTHIQDEIDNDKLAHPKTHNPQTVLRRLRGDCEKRLECEKQYPVFLIDSFETRKYDFHSLAKEFDQDIAEAATSCVFN